MTTEAVVNKPVGYQQHTNLAAAITLDTVPATGTRISGITNGPVRALLQAESQDIRFTDDGTTPTAAIGMKLVKDTIFPYEGDLDKLKFIEAAASAKLNVLFYRY